MWRFHKGLDSYQGNRSISTAEELSKDFNNPDSTADVEQVHRSEGNGQSHMVAPTATG